MNNDGKREKRKENNQMNEVDKLVQGVGKAIDKVPEIYDDGLKPATKESGKVLALIPQTINAALAPLRQWIAQKEYNVAETEKLLAQKLEKVEYQKIVSPESYVAVPAIQAIAYSMNSEELRELYANLLAKSMYIETKERVHPSFVEIIKQMSPIDALVFKKIMGREVNPMINLIMKNEKGEFRTIITNVTDINIVSQELIGVSIDNLTKQNLLSVPDDGFYSNEKVYDSILQTEFYDNQKNINRRTVDGFEFTYTKKMINKTNLGKLFYKVCVAEI